MSLPPTFPVDGRRGSLARQLAKDAAELPAQLAVDQPARRMTQPGRYGGGRLISSLVTVLLSLTTVTMPMTTMIGGPAESR